MLFYNKMIYKNYIKISQENYKFESCPLFTYEWRWNLEKNTCNTLYSEKQLDIF